MWVILLLIVVFLVLCMVVAVDTNRVLAGINRSSWTITPYRLHLPDLLALLSRAGETMPWPDRVSGLAIWRFRMKLRRLLRDQKGFSPTMAEWHIGFWVFVDEHRSLLDFALCTATADAALRLHQCGPDPDREHYSFLIQQYQKQLKHLRRIIRRDFGSGGLARAQHLWLVLQRTEIIFNEHGFHIHEGFVRLRSLQEALETKLPSAERQ